MNLSVQQSGTAVRVRNEIVIHDNTAVTTRRCRRTMKLFSARHGRSPLDVRFCNPWHVASDYRVEVNLGQNRVIGIRLSGATVATPQACEDPCPPPVPGRTTP